MYLCLIMKRLEITSNEEFMKPLILIKKDSSELLVNSSLCLIKGEVGSGKSRLAMNIMVGFSGVSDDLGLEYKPCPDDKYIIYISTEMSRYHLQRRRKHIIDKTGKDYEERLKFFDFAYVSAADKIKELREVCTEFPPWVIIIDQLGDFVTNVNDIDQSMELVKQLMNGIEKYDCGIIGIIHQNEDSGISSKARGHAGSIFEQKVVSSIAIADTSRGFTIQTTKLREGRQIKIYAVFNEESEMLKYTELIKDEELLNRIKFPCNASDLDNQIATLTKMSVPTARNIKKKLQEEGKIKSVKEGKNEIYSLN